MDNDSRKWNITLLIKPKLYILPANLAVCSQRGECICTEDDQKV